jgi:putative endonuclease
MEDVKKLYVYILRCIDGTFYVGVTNDVDRRFWEHEHDDDRAHYTYARRPLRLVSVSEFDSPSDAIAFEKRLKGWTHRKKRAFVEGHWNDLRRYSRGGSTTRDDDG